MKPAFGAAIIAKNEESNILGALQSVADVCEQIVVVDTGSIDVTPDIALRFGAEVFFADWKDDFSLARNFALSHIRTDWTIVIDCDERLDNKTFNSFDGFYLNPGIGGVTTVLRNYLDTKHESYSEHSFTRIFKNDSKIRFSGRIHEQVAESINALGLSIIDSPIVINHYGYINPSVEKKIRNKILLSKEVDENPNDDWLLYHTAITEFGLGNYSEAKSLFESILESKLLSQDQIETAVLKLMQISLNTGNYTFLLSREYKRFADDNKEGLRLALLGSYYIEKGFYSKAKQAFQNPVLLQSNLVEKSIVDKAVKIFRLLK